MDFRATGILGILARRLLQSSGQETVLTRQIPQGVVAEMLVWGGLSTLL